MKLAKRSYWMVLLMAAALAAPAMRASTIDAALDNPFVVANPGDIVPFGANLSLDGGASDAVFLNSDVSYVDSPLLLDDGGFFANFPLSLNPGDSVDGTLFTITVPVGTPDGIYTGSFQIFGGVGGDAGDQIASLAFNVQVGQSTPEPGAIALAGLGLVGLVTGRVAKRLRGLRR